MGFAAAMSAIGAYRSKRVGALLGEYAPSWFLSAWGSVADMLKAFTSESENKDIQGLYASGKAEDRRAAHIKHDYVCGMRREVRKQYVSGETGIVTDVTPFGRGVVTLNGADMFDSLLHQILERKGGQK